MGVGVFAIRFIKTLESVDGRDFMASEVLGWIPSHMDSIQHEINVSDFIYKND